MSRDNQREDEWGRCRAWEDDDGEATLTALGGDDFVDATAKKCGCSPTEALPWSGSVVYQSSQQKQHVFFRVLSCD